MMYRVLVVDDEPYVRKGIINKIKWKNLGLELIGEAEGGTEALSMVPGLNPDILITDMRMPDMDGIMLIKEIHKIRPNIKTVVISAYSDFNYTREAIKNNVFDYVLKPVGKDELNSVLFNCRNAIEQQDGAAAYSKLTDSEEMIELLIEKYVLNLSMSAKRFDEKYARVESYLDFPNVFCCVCRVDQLPEAQKQYAGDELFTLLQQDIENLLKQTFVKHLVFSNLPYQEVIIVFSHQFHAKEEILHLLQKIFRFVELNRKFTISIGIGNCVATPYDLYSSYNQALKALKMKRVSGAGFVADQSALVNDCSVDMLCSGYDENFLLNEIKSGNEQNSLKYFNSIISKYVARDVTVYSLQRSMVILLGSMEKMLDSSGISMEKEFRKSSLTYVNEILGAFCVSEIRNIFTEVICILVGFYSSKNKKSGQKIVEEIVARIKKDCTEPFSIYNLAKEYYLSPDYLGRIFKNQTGMAFNDFLAETRIDKAKEILCGSDCRHCYEVAGKVGYDDYSYFCRVFKMFTGFTPNEYRNNAFRK